MAERDRSKAARVLELCRKLKPVIGAQADRIWLAYVAENESGKQQLLDYLEILTAQQFQGSLDDQGPGLLPPKAEAAAGEYALGTVTYNGADLFPFGLREHEWPQHVGVFGRSGSGKTNVGFLIVKTLVENRKPVLVLDFKRNYRDLAQLPGFENLAIYTAGRSVAPWRFNPLIPPEGTSPETWVKKIVAVLATAYLLGDGSTSILQDAVNQVYTDAGVYTGKVQHWPTLRDVYEVLKQRPAKGREAGWTSSAIRGLNSLCFGEIDKLVNHGHDPIENLLGRSVVIELDALAQSDKTFVTQALILWIHQLRLAEPIREAFRNTIVIEEAHQVLAGERRSLLGGQSIMELAFREIREFGASIVYLDQMPSSIAPSALANTYAVLCFNLKHRADVTVMGQAMLLEDDERDILGNLQVGEAVVRLQGRSVKPFMIHVPEFHIKKGAFTDPHVIHHMTRLGLLSARDHAIQRGVRLIHYTTPGLDSVPTPAAGRGESAAHQMLLLDIAAFPQAGVAERYKRLGFSVRLGQKVKSDLSGKGLIVEQVEMTSRGKLRIIRLTEKGRSSLDSWENTSSKAA